MSQEVSIIAPSDMEEGYQFDAQVDGKTVSHCFGASVLQCFSEICMQQYRCDFCVPAELLLIQFSSLLIWIIMSLVLTQPSIILLLWLIVHCHSTTGRCPCRRGVHYRGSLCCWRWTQPISIWTFWVLDRWLAICDGMLLQWLPVGSATAKTEIEFLWCQNERWSIREFLYHYDCRLWNCPLVGIDFGHCHGSWFHDHVHLFALFGGSLDLNAVAYAQSVQNSRTNVWRYSSGWLLLFLLVHMLYASAIDASYTWWEGLQISIWYQDWTTRRSSWSCIDWKANGSVRWFVVIEAMAIYRSDCFKHPHLPLSTFSIGK